MNATVKYEPVTLALEESLLILRTPSVVLGPRSTKRVFLYYIGISS